ncbi:MAG: MgtC/SapB family protein [archaeon]|nr:MgtC/SapB family protein [archaeon]
MLEGFLSGFEVEFATILVFSLIIGYVIGAEREGRGKAAGISTHSLVIAGSALFTFGSIWLDPASPARIAAQIVTGVGFLGAGIILKDNSGEIRNLTTAASIWFSASIGMAIGFGWYAIALIAMIYAVAVPRIPHYKHGPRLEEK